jgi:hypothetical protein
MPLEELDPEDIEQRFRKMKSACNVSKNTFDMMKLKNPKNMADNMLKVLETFEPWIRVIRALNVEGLKPKHMARINQKINEGKDIEMNLELNMDI